MWPFKRTAKSYEPAKIQVSISTSSQGADRFESTASPVTTPRQVAQEKDDISSVDEDRLNITGLGGDPMTPCEWSNLTSPGFTMRALQEAGASPGSPLRDYGNFSLFSKSPNAHLKLGQLPRPSLKRKPCVSPSPVRKNFHASSRKRENHDEGSVYIRLAPVDLDKLSALPVTSPLGMPGNAPDGMMRSPGLGGTPKVMFRNTVKRMWPPPGAVPERQQVPNTGMRPTYSPGSPPPSIMDVLANRKRGRIHDGSLDQMGAMKAQVNLGLDELAGKHNKKMKYYSHGHAHAQDDERSRLHHMMPLSNLDSTEEPMMTSESILEQMNQTEKRFFPDDPPLTRSSNKKSKTTSTPRLSGGSQLYKKKRLSNVINLVEDDISEKVARFCTCSECYADSAGITNLSPPKPAAQNSSKQSSQTSLMSIARDDASTSTAQDQDVENGIGSPNKTFSEAGVGTDIIGKNVVVRESGLPPGGFVAYQTYLKDRSQRLNRLNKLFQGEPDSKQRSVQSFAQGPFPFTPSMPTGMNSSLPVSQVTSTQVTSTAFSAGNFTFGGVPAQSITTGSSSINSVNKSLEASITQHSTENTASSVKIPVPTRLEPKQTVLPQTNIASPGPSSEGFSFGNDKSFNATTTTSNAGSGAGFSFGNNNINTSSPKPIEEIPKPSITVSPSTGGFSFGGTSTSTPTTTPGAKDNQTTSVLTVTPKPVSGGFSFGNANSSNNNMPAGSESGTARVANPVPSTASSAFSFGTTGAAPATGGFSFGKTTTNADNAVTSTPSVNITSVPSSAFSFSSPSASKSTPESGFQFGNTATAVPTTTTSNPSQVPTITSSNPLAFGNFAAPKPQNVSEPTSSLPSLSVPNTLANVSSVQPQQLPPPPYGQTIFAPKPADSSASQSVTTPFKFGTPSTSAGPAPSTAGNLFGTAVPSAGSGDGPFVNPIVSSTSFQFGSTSQPNISSPAPASGFPLSTSTNSSASLFGSVPTTTTAPTLPTNSTPVFGQSASAPTAPTTTATSTGFNFGGATTTNSTFQFGQTPASGSSSSFGSFGGANGGSSAFGNATNSQGTATAAGSGFGQAQPSTSNQFSFGSQTNQPGASTSASFQFGQASSSAAPTKTASSGFSGFGTASNTLGGNGFGQPATTQAGGIGQPATKTTSVFGQAANNQPASSFNFGQPAQPASSTGAFQFGQNQQNPSASGTFAFGGTNDNSTTGPGFGQQNSTSNNTSTFGQQNSTSNTSTFGQQSSASNTSTFGQQSSTSNTSTFGQPNTSNSNAFNFSAQANQSAPAPANTPFQFQGPATPAPAAAAVPFNLTPQINFSPGLPAQGGGSPMFSMGSSSTSARRRDPRVRRHR